MDTFFLALRVVLSLAAVLGLLWMAQRRLTRKSRKLGAQKLVTVITRQGIGQKASVVVVETEGKRFLLGVTEQSVNVLHTSDAPAAVAAQVEDSPARAFELALMAAGTPVIEPPLFAQPVFEAPRPVFGMPLAATQHASMQQPNASSSGAPQIAKPQAAKLGGSILSPATWKQAAAFIRQGS